MAAMRARGARCVLVGDHNLVRGADDVLAASTPHKGGLDLLAVLLRLVACTPLASVVQLAVVPPAMSMDKAQGAPQASTIESFVEAKFLESYPEAEQMSTADLRDWAKDLRVPGVGKRTGRTKLLKDVCAFLQQSMNQN